VRLTIYRRPARSQNMFRSGTTLYVPVDEEVYAVAAEDAAAAVSRGT
jgi:hypothetical protein